MRSYFAEKNFLLLYLYRMFYRASSALIHIFTGTYLVHTGVPISTVILFYALTVFVIALTSPIGVASVIKYGLKKSAVFSVLFRTSFFLLFLLVEQGYDLLLWPAAIIWGATFGILPVRDIMEAVYIKKDHHRGKQMTMAMVLSSLLVGLAIAFAGYLLPIYGFISIVILSVILQIGSVWALLQMKGEPLHIEDYKIKNGFKIAIQKNPLKGSFSLVWGEQMMLSVFTIIIPLYIFNVIGNIQSYAFLAAGATALEAGSTLIFGRFLDNSKGSRAHKQSAVMMLLSSIFLIFFVKTPLSALLADSYNRIALNTQIATCNTAIHKILRSKDTGKLLLFGAIWQMTHSFFEVFFLLALALIYYYFGFVVFTVAFTCSALGALINYNFFRKRNQ